VALVFLHRLADAELTSTARDFKLESSSKRFRFLLAFVRARLSVLRFADNAELSLGSNETVSVRSLLRHSRFQHGRSLRRLARQSPPRLLAPANSTTVNHATGGTPCCATKLRTHSKSPRFQRYANPTSTMKKNTSKS